MNIFGSDGFRSKFGEKFMTLDFIIKFSTSVGFWLNGQHKTVLVGRDTRASGQIIENILISILNYMGFTVEKTGVVASPVMSKLLSLGDYSLGVMITASHNPASDNGIKLFAPDGTKLDPDAERLIENGINVPKELAKASTKLGISSEVQNVLSTYINSVSNIEIYRCCKKKVMVDCSFGGFSGLNEEFEKLKHLKFLNYDFDGENINKYVGALEPEILLQHVRDEDFDYGIAFDGDGDRAVIVSNASGIIPSEKIAYLFACSMLTKSDQRCVVTSEIVNCAFNDNMKQLGFDVLETQVGDRHVINECNKVGALFAFEPSGHFFFPKENKTMDGFLAFTNFIKLLSQQDLDVELEIASLKHFARVNSTLPVDVNSIQPLRPILRSEIEEMLLKGREKFVVRQSMWDPVIRIYYDYAEENRYPLIQAKVFEILNRK